MAGWIGASIIVVFEEKLDEEEEEERHLMRGNHFDGFNMLLLSDDAMSWQEVRLFEVWSLFESLENNRVETDRILFGKLWLEVAVNVIVSIIMIIKKKKDDNKKKKKSINLFIFIPFIFKPDMTRLPLMKPHATVINVL